MPIFTAENRDAWTDVFASVAHQCPYKGRHVTITQGKHQGTQGLVTWHGSDTYNRGARYMDSAMLALREARGREGYRIRVQPDEGEAFFCKAEYAEVDSPGTAA